MEKSVIDWLVANWPTLVMSAVVVGMYLKYIRVYQRLILKHEKILQFMLLKHMTHHPDPKETEQIVEILNELE